MNSVLYGQLQQRLSGVEDGTANLILAACHGTAGLEKLLAGESRGQVLESEASLSQPVGVYLRAITVKGFRGIGPERCLELTPGPGLTLVLGRNGSGKSSFAEALEVLLTGDSSRWIDRPKVWREGWQNLHAADAPEVRAEFMRDGSTENVVVGRKWATGGRLEQGVLSRPLEAGWEFALSTYRPFLSYSELADLVNQEPSRLHDGLSAILGLGDLVDAEKVLRDARLPREKEAKACSERSKGLVARLTPLADPRAAACREAMAGKSQKLDVVEQQLTDPPDESLGAVRELAGLEVPDPSDVLARLASLRERAKELQGSQTERALSAANLLELALAHRRQEPSQDCPVCGAALPSDWTERTRVEVERLRLAAGQAEALRKEQAACERDARSLCSRPPAVLGADVHGFNLASALEAWSAWHNDAGNDLEHHLSSRHESLRNAVLPVIEQARRELERRSGEWQPLALELAAWLVDARRVERERNLVKRLSEAEKWLKKASEELRNERLRPVAESALAHYAQLRQDSNVLLKGIALEGGGQSTQRRVALDVQIDDVEGAALGVMSQGELNALALSLFLPRATLPESPFRFVVIDDPVQAMDPAKVDGLARVLETTAKTHQVLVFTHDARLYESVRRLGIDARVVAVTRRERSVVELRQDLDPVSRSLADASDLARTDKLDRKVSARVVPRFCRDALEAALAELVRHRLFAIGRRHVEIEDQLREAKTLNKLAALAFCGDVREVPAAQQHLRSLGGWATFQALNTGSHDAHTGNLVALVEQTRELVRMVKN